MFYIYRVYLLLLLSAGLLLYSYFTLDLSSSLTSYFFISCYLYFSPFFSFKYISLQSFFNISIWSLLLTTPSRSHTQLHTTSINKCLEYFSLKYLIFASCVFRSYPAAYPFHFILVLNGYLSFPHFLTNPYYFILFLLFFLSYLSLQTFQMNAV